MSEPLFDQQNAGYVQLLYEEYSRNPESLPEAWRKFFSQGPIAASQAGLLVPDALVQDGTSGDSPGTPPASAETSAPGPEPGPLPDQASEQPLGDPSPQLILAEECGRDRLALVARSAYLVRSFRSHGHQMARLDPLGSEPPGHPELEPSFFGTTREELEQVPASVIEPGWGDEPLAWALTRLEKAYCASIGYEFEHLEDPEKVRWLWEYVESSVHSPPLEPEEKRSLLERLSEVEGFEHFLHRAYLGQKRFSLEGTDMMVPMLDESIRLAAKAGCREVVMGMAHRGRLNVLVHILGVTYKEIIRGFEGIPLRKTVLSVPLEGTGDVKYHHGADGSFTSRDGDRVRISLAPNPSHLEFVNPVVEGITRSRQFVGTGKELMQEVDSVVPILIHGDAAFAAEGIVAETLNLARLPGYTTGGTLHIITNNQVGFTTKPREGRSTRYASDLAKGYDIPIMHVNADDPESCLAVVRLAMAYRARFHDDVVIDLVGYRRHGHNEGDEPAYTQPLQYQRIESHPTVTALWADRLVQEGVATLEQVKRLKDDVAARIREAQDQVRAEEAEDRPEVEAGDQVRAGETQDQVRAGETQDRFEGEAEADEPSTTAVVTRVPLQDLIRLNAAALSYPEGFKVHPKLAKQLNRRREGFGPSSPLEWAHAETLAFATLLEDGVPVRLSGQDSGRGTFSQRHLVLHHGETGEMHVPLQHIGTARFEVYNSPLTEMALLGFEYGYAVAADPDLILWEGQFGDFVNVAQVIIDQFIASGRAKWGQEARLTLLLPHGHEGQGPEHTSARLERFLQLCAEDNMRVAYPTTPAQYFHLLRRQALTPVVRPLVVMTPKSLLRHPRATSPLSELAEGSFRPVLGDASAAGRPEEIRRLVLCSGKLYYDMETHSKRESQTWVAVGRIEEMHPFPAEALRDLVASFPNLQEVVWAQEEPTNMGGLFFIGPRLRAVVPRTIPLRPVARPERASPAEGRTKDHLKAQKQIVETALGIGGG